MNDLLSAIKYNLKLYKTTTLSKVKTYKKGILPPIPIYPAVAILPEDEYYFGFGSKKKYKAIRRIRFDIYGHGYDLGNTYTNTMEITNAIKNIVTTKHQWTDSSGNDQCYNTFKEEEIFGEPYPFKNRYLQKSSVTISCYSFECLPTQILSVTPVEETAEDFLTTLYDKVKSYKSTTLSHIKSFAKGITPPLSTYPAVVVSENTETPIQYEAGRSRLERTFDIVVYHKLLDKEGILERVLKEVENVKEIVFTNPKWDGKAVWTIIDGVDYGVFINENSYLYAAYVTITVNAKKVTNFCS